MSYILEALKKAQAERQLGDTPTLHAAQAVPAEAARTPARRMPMLVGAAAGMVGAGAVAMLFWRHEAPPQLAAVAQAPVSTAAAVPAPAIPAAAQATAAGTAAPVAAPVQVAAAGPAIATPSPAAPARHVAAEPSNATALAPATVPAPDRPSSARHAPAAGPRTSVPAARTEAPLAASEPAARAPAAEEVVRTLAELPDAIQREVPKVAFGGYMYSPNAADRLVLVDKTLRHEGEELAPGLLLEKLLPKTAVLNYKGYRFRVGL